ncbi:stAR-related lipid transfer protein 9 isoform A [Patagioenas fasciata monilis]|uniref:StAR-related lipid transfer protein 9 n=1 Tax=Patagioenas fasciata monilis TaxID=372326 RepID=A0A1V4KF32_PATFA|nr:stAR-related lipid transfer protein 9 isoform A [Patagioenas fasciata monilis]
MANVKVAVRVRPLSKRESAEGGRVIVEVDDKVAKVRNIKVDSRLDSTWDSREKTVAFSFDYCYWSVDPEDPKYASQEMVFQDLGTSVLSGAFKGYNICLFAYGQTGSGKTYTMMGTPASIGLTPRICEGLFSRKDDYSDQIASCRVKVSFLEIYNERVRDLLKQSDQKKPYTLRVREHPETGPYVQGLTQHLVTDYKQVVELLEEGIAKRITAATHIHNASSRSHAIFTIHYTQAILENHLPSEIASKINLVDLAGSERADPSYCKDRITEGANINKSLVTLGIVISTLAQNSQMFSSCQSINTITSEGESSHVDSPATGGVSGTRRPAYIPYRDSILTWLLKDSLGGNSKTIMIATISPASSSYNETMSTLRYASNAKNIINKPRVNEDANVKLIRELREEIDRLKTMLMSFELRNSSPSWSDDRDSNLTELVLQNEMKIEQLTKDWTSKWTDRKAIMEEYSVDINKEKAGVKIASSFPHLMAMDDDILSTGVVLYHLREGTTKIGRSDSDQDQDIVLQGWGIERDHCMIDNNGGIVTLRPVPGARCAVNGCEVTGSCRLSQGALVVLGKSHKFRFNHPAEAAILRQRRSINETSPIPSCGALDWLKLDGSCTHCPHYILSSLENQKCRNCKENEFSLELSREIDAVHEEYKQKLRDQEAFHRKQIQRQQLYVEDLKQQILRGQIKAERELENDQALINQQIQENQQWLINENKRLAALQQQQREFAVQTESALYVEAEVQSSIGLEICPSLLQQNKKRLVQLELLRRHSLKKAERNIRRKKVKFQLERIVKKQKLLEAKQNLEQLEASCWFHEECVKQSQVLNENNTVQSSLDHHLQKRRRSLQQRQRSCGNPRVPQVPSYLLKRETVSKLSTSPNIGQCCESNTTGRLSSVEYLYRRGKAVSGNDDLNDEKVQRQLTEKQKPSSSGNKRGGEEYSNDLGIMAYINKNDQKIAKLDDNPGEAGSQNQTSKGSSPDLFKEKDEPETFITGTRMKKTKVLGDLNQPASSNLEQNRAQVSNEKTRMDINGKGHRSSLENFPKEIKKTVYGNPRSANLNQTAKNWKRELNSTLPSHEKSSVEQQEFLMVATSVGNLTKMNTQAPLYYAEKRWHSAEMLSAGVSKTATDVLGNWQEDEENEISDTDSSYSVDSLSCAYAKTFTEKLKQEDFDRNKCLANPEDSESDDSQMSQDSLVEKENKAKKQNKSQFHRSKAKQEPAKLYKSRTDHRISSLVTSYAAHRRLGKSERSFSLDSLADGEEMPAEDLVEESKSDSSDEVPAEIYWKLQTPRSPAIQTDEDHESKACDRDTEGTNYDLKLSSSFYLDTKLKPACKQLLEGTKVSLVEQERSLDRRLYYTAKHDYYQRSRSNHPEQEQLNEFSAYRREEDSLPTTHPELPKDHSLKKKPFISVVPMNIFEQRNGCVDADLEDDFFRASEKDDLSDDYNNLMTKSIVAHSASYDQSATPVEVSEEEIICMETSTDSLAEIVPEVPSCKDNEEYEPKDEDLSSLNHYEYKNKPVSKHYSHECALADRQKNSMHKMTDVSVDFDATILLETEPQNKSLLEATEEKEAFLESDCPEDILLAEDDNTKANTDEEITKLINSTINLEKNALEVKSRQTESLPDYAVVKVQTSEGQCEFYTNLCLTHEEAEKDDLQVYCDRDDNEEILNRFKIPERYLTASGLLENDSRCHDPTEMSEDGVSVDSVTDTRNAVMEDIDAVGSRLEEEKVHFMNLVQMTEIDKEKQIFVENTEEVELIISQNLNELFPENKGSCQMTHDDSRLNEVLRESQWVSTSFSRNNEDISKEQNPPATLKSTEKKQEGSLKDSPCQSVNHLLYLGVSDDFHLVQSVPTALKGHTKPSDSSVETGAVLPYYETLLESEICAGTPVPANKTREDKYLPDKMQSKNVAFLQTRTTQDWQEEESFIFKNATDYAVSGQPIKENSSSTRDSTDDPESETVVLQEGAKGNSFCLEKLDSSEGVTQDANNTHEEHTVDLMFNKLSKDCLNSIEDTAQEKKASSAAVLIASNGDKGDEKKSNSTIKETTYAQDNKLPEKGATTDQKEKIIQEANVNSKSSSVAQCSEGKAEEAGYQPEAGLFLQDNKDTMHFSSSDINPYIHPWQQDGSCKIGWKHSYATAKVLSSTLSSIEGLQGWDGVRQDFQSAYSSDSTKQYSNISSETLETNPENNTAEFGNPSAQPDNEQNAKIKRRGMEEAVKVTRADSGTQTTADVGTQTEILEEPQRKHEEKQVEPKVEKELREAQAVNVVWKGIDADAVGQDVSKDLEQRHRLMVDTHTTVCAKRLYHSSSMLEVSGHREVLTGDLGDHSPLTRSLRCMYVTRRGKGSSSGIGHEKYVDDNTDYVTESDCDTEILLNKNTTFTKPYRPRSYSLRDLPIHNKFSNWCGVKGSPSPSSLSLSSSVTDLQSQAEKKPGITRATEMEGKYQLGDSRSREIERLQRERARIMSGLHLDLHQQPLTVELAEAKLSYGIGETDALLRVLQSGTADDLVAVPVKQQLYERHMRTIETLRKEREKRLQRYQRSRSLSPQKHLSLLQTLDASRRDPDLPSRRREYLQQLRRDVVENTRVQEPKRRSIQHPSDIELLLRDYQRAREETKSEIARARDKLRERAEQEKKRIREQIFSQLQKEEARLKTLASTSTLCTDSSLSLSSGPTSGYNSSNTATYTASNLSSQDQQVSSGNASLSKDSRGRSAVRNSQLYVLEQLQKDSTFEAVRTQPPLPSSSISCRFTHGLTISVSSSSTKGYQDLSKHILANATTEVMAACSHNLRNLYTCQAAAGWKYQCTEKEVLVYYKVFPSATRHGFLGAGVIERPLPCVWGLVRDPGKRHLYDRTINTARIHKKVTSHIQLVYLVTDTSLCYLKQPRDFCCITVEAKEENLSVLAVQSVYDASMPHPCKEVVRGEILPSAWILEPDVVNGRDITRVIYMAQVDLGAPAIPARLLSSMAKRQPLVIARLAHFLAS